MRFIVVLFLGRGVSYFIRGHGVGLGIGLGFTGIDMFFIRRNWKIGSGCFSLNNHRSFSSGFMSWAWSQSRHWGYLIF